MLLVTYKCNLRCSYCYEPKFLTSHMTEEQVQGILSKEIPSIVDTCDELEIHFMGGEPLLEFQMLKNIAEWLWTKPFAVPHFKFFAPTNGTLLTEEKKNWFSEHRQQFYLGLSFDGDMEMQNRNRSSSFSNVDLDFFVSTWPEQSVKMTISPETVDCLSEGVTFLHKKGFKYISADLAMGPTIEWTSGKLYHYKEELDKLADYYLSESDLIPCSLFRMNIMNGGKHRSHSIKSCSCGEDIICIDLTGAHYACHLFSPIAIPATKANKCASSVDFSNHELFVSVQCRNCFLESVCEQCYGMNYICNGNVASPTVSHCSASKLRFAANCRFREKKAMLEADTATLNEIKHMLKKLKI